MGQKSEAIQYYGMGVPYGQRPFSGAGAAVWLGISITKLFVAPQPIALRVGTQLDFRTTAIVVAPQPIALSIEGGRLQVSTTGIWVVLQPLWLATNPVQLTIGTTPVLVQLQPISEVSTGNEPVYVWHAPDKQCDPRTLSRDVIVLQPYEEVWCAFDFEDVLDNNSSVVSSVVYIDDSNTGYYQSPPGAIIDRRLVKFQLSIPSDALEADINLEVAIIDSKNNRHVVDGTLRIRE